MSFKQNLKPLKKDPPKIIKILLNKIYYILRGYPFWRQLKENVVIKGKKLEIGVGSTIYEYVVLKAKDGFIRIGKNVTIHSFCFLSGGGGIRIGDNCRISNSNCIIAFNHTYKSKDKLIKDQGLENLGIEIDEDCWIGSNCSILGGTKLGRGCVVGAGSVVNKEFPPYSVIAGVPAKIIGKRE